MMDKIKEFFRKLLTEPDNSTPCIIRIVGSGGVLQGLASHAYQTFWLHVPFDFMAFAGGLAAAIGALGLALGLKKDTPQ